MRNYKVLHKEKAVQTYKAGKYALRNDLPYAAYSMLKESVRATLAYINEDLQGRNYSSKTDLSTLFNEIPRDLLENNTTDDFKIFLELEEEGLFDILNAEFEPLDKARVTLKKIISVYLREDV